MYAGDPTLKALITVLVCTISANPKSIITGSREPYLNIILAGFKSR